MKKLLVIALLVFGVAGTLQQANAQIASSLGEFTVKDQNLIKEVCPVCTDGALIVDDKGNCCCVKKDGTTNCNQINVSSNDPILDKQALQQLGIGAVDPCDDQGACLIVKQLKKSKTAFSRIVLVTPAMEKFLKKAFK
ncbi:hypothetical protein C7N43_27470 [Sphingobacteriales bacterium UPWRP_1]|nr:hypothetical protein BVG80_05320 [Sphingobacteriales bacterium TSM_CSM]PSJ73780.1 hypothetical protein C7N43_27470 [Sphingobacteriales bacterium UPWRP_1]